MTLEAVQGIRSTANALHALCLIKCKFAALSNQQSDISSFHIREKMFNDEYSSMNDLNQDIEKLKHRMMANNVDFRPVISELTKITNSPFIPGRIMMNTEEQEEMALDGKIMIEEIMDLTDSEERKLCHHFLRLPAKKFYPDYYSEIKFPMTMSKISSKLHLKQYISICEILNDLTLCFRNAQLYNRDDSDIHQNAIVLYQIACDKFCQLLETKDIIPYIYNVSTAQRHFYSVFKKDKDRDDSISSPMPSQADDDKIPGSVEDFKNMIEKLKLEKYQEIPYFNYYIANGPNMLVEKLKQAVQNSNSSSFSSFDDFICLLHRIHCNITFDSKFPRACSADFLKKACELASVATQVEFEPYFGPLKTFTENISSIFKKFNNNKKIAKILAEVPLNLEYLELNTGVLNFGTIMQIYTELLGKNCFTDIFSATKFISRLLNFIALNLSPNDSEYMILTIKMNECLNLALECEKDGIRFKNHHKDMCNINSNGDLVFWTATSKCFCTFVTELEKNNGKFLSKSFKNSPEFFCQFDLLRELVFTNSFSGFEDLIGEFANMLSVAQNCHHALEKDQFQLLNRIATRNLSRFVLVPDLLFPGKGKPLEELMTEKNQVFCREFYLVNTALHDDSIAMLTEVQGTKVTCQILVPSTCTEFISASNINFGLVENEYFLTDRIEKFKVNDLFKPVNVIPRHFARRLNNLCEFPTVIGDFRIDEGYISQRIICMPRYHAFDLKNSPNTFTTLAVQNLESFYSFKCQVEFLRKKIRTTTSMFSKDCDKIISLNKLYQIKVKNDDQFILFKPFLIEIRTQQPFAVLGKKCEIIELPNSDYKSFKITEEDLNIGAEELANGVTEFCVIDRNTHKAGVPIGFSKDEILLSDSLSTEQVFGHTSVKPRLELPSLCFNSSGEKIAIEDHTPKVRINEQKQLSNVFAQLSKTNETLKSVIGSTPSGKRTNQSVICIPNQVKRGKFLPQSMTNVAVQTEESGQNFYSGPFITNNIGFKSSNYFSPVLFHSEIYSNFCDRVLAESVADQ